MKFKLTKEEFNSLEDTVKVLYAENDSGYQLIIEGYEDLSPDVERLKRSLDAERSAHKESKNALTEKINNMESLIKPKEPIVDHKDKDISPDILALRKIVENQSVKLEEILKEKEVLQFENKSKSIIDGLKKISNGKILPEAVDDLIMYKDNFDLTEDGNLVTKDGTLANDWFVETLKTKSHWVPKSTSAGAKGGNDITSKSSTEKRYNELMAKDGLDLREQSEAMSLAKEIKTAKEAV